MSPQDPAQLQTAIKRFAYTLSQREIAKRAGISRTTLSKILQGKPVRHAGLVIGTVLNAIKDAEQEKEEEDTRSKAMPSVRPKEQWLERIEGFRADESPAQLRHRIAEIDRLENLFVSGRLKGYEIEKTQRRLCELRGIYFDGHDPQDD
jgi:transcriptional regulator with XRE-family HTH domain